jgi:bifunctional non-homologous end joining protein LigD
MAMASPTPKATKKPAKRAPSTVSKKAAKKVAKKAATKRPAARKGARAEADIGAPSSLAKYQSMRDFERTAEPAGGAVDPASAHDSFVIQKHDASHLHYDFRLELDGVLLSWSVPKGPSLRPGERRLAVRTEDHPLEYASFEGIIPKGEYGGGTVIVWDRGTWKPEVDTKAPTPEAMLKKGHFAFTLSGQKLQGRFHLVRTKKPGEKQELWLLFKGKDEHAREKSDIVSERPESALSGRTVEEVAKTPGDVWHSNRTEKKTAPKVKAAAVASAAGADRPDVVQLVKRLPLPFKLTNLDKVLYPENNLRKADLIAYYAAVASYALPHLAGRPLTLVRCPNGRAQKCFFQKQANDNVPAVVQRIDVAKQGDKKSSVAEMYMAVNDLPGMVAMAQVGALELHTWGCHADQVERPDQFVFDLDPDLSLSWDAVVEAAFLVRAHLARLDLDSFVKTTGGKGLHVVVPVERKLDWDTHREFAKALADLVAREQPTRYLTNMRKDLRKGKLFIDWMRNGRGATAIAPYSTRAREGATVATPVTWEELEAGVDPLKLDVYGVIHRLEALAADPWRDYASTKQAVSARALKALGIKG